MVCSAAVGMPMMMSTRSKVTKVEYSSGPIFRATVCTKAINAPPAKVAMTIQPLCRKKPDSRFTSISSRQGGEKLKGAIRGRLEGFSLNPFVGRIGLSNIAGAEDDAGNARVRQNRRIAKIM